MPKSLVIVESPAKAKTINKFLGKDYKVLACMGHIRDLPKKDLAIDIENDFQPKYQTIQGKGKVITQIRNAAKEAENIFVATDPDREGEAIAWHVAHEVGKGGREVQRVTFNEITRNAVLSGIASPQVIDIQKVNAQQARRVLDRLVGYKVSPLLWKTVHGGLSAGRVQSVALRMICEREEEITRFVQREYWTIDADLATGKGDVFRATAIRKGRQKLEIPNQAEAERIVEELRGPAYGISEITRREQKRNPAPPFITSTLQQEAARKLNFTAKKTMAVAQQLYEGIDLEGETTGLITYMRTDSTRLSPEAVADARDYIATAYGPDYVPEKPNVYKARKGAQDAHEAIRPTAVSRPPKAVRRFLTEEQAALYQLIWDRFIASQMKPALLDVTTVDITAGDYGLRATGSTVKFRGFTVLYTETTDDAVAEENRRIPEGLKVGDVLKLLALHPDQHFTKPPPRYSEASLVKELEAQGIGRPSTYAQIISTLQDRDYVSRERGRFMPTSLGTTVNTLLVRAFPDIFNTQFTASMEEALDKVETGEDDWVAVVRGFYVPFAKDLSQMESQRAELKKSLQEETDEVCEKCGQKFVIKWGRNGRFMACTGFPACKNTRPLNGEEEVELAEGETCEKCGAAMVVRNGSRGRFLACSAYPGCKSTRPLSLGVPCPKEGCGGTILERQSKRGKVFYGCSRYPACDFATWDRPTARPCPDCGAPFLLSRSSQRRGEFLQCPVCKASFPMSDPAGGEPSGESLREEEPIEARA
ncbi:MAG: type I DNA topoisomerase [Candidatus Latescibacteria bacterium]|nr:type I DNA topoisomerase [Candidatus Latescibacterota bacterium]